MSTPRRWALFAFFVYGLLVAELLTLAMMLVFGVEG